MPKSLTRSPLRLQFSDHGGNCCGMTHLYGFGSYTDAYLTNAKTNRREIVAVGVMTILAREYPTDEDDTPSSSFMKHRHCIEVVLSEHQIDEWDVPLTKEGFKRVFSFENANSGNNCFVYMLETGIR